jgi:Fe2+ transport system protein FeoA
MTLDQLSIGTSAELTNIDRSLILRPRLMEMGLTPGISLSVIRVAPLGDPIEILVRGTRISLSKGDASGIHCRTT